MTISKNDRISLAALRDLVAYDPDTSRMTWRTRNARDGDDPRGVSAFNTRCAGKEAMIRVDAHGYRVGTIYGVKIQAHRAIWALHYGGWPDGEIDHINGDRQDNRIENLRAVSRTSNCRNMARSKRNKSGVTGVRFNPNQGAWVAFIGCRHIGTFDDQAKAVVARKAAEIEIGYHANHGRDPSMRAF